MCVGCVIRLLLFRLDKLFFPDDNEKSSQQADVGIVAKLKDDPLALELSPWPCSDSSPENSSCLNYFMSSTMMLEKDGKGVQHSDFAFNVRISKVNIKRKSRFNPHPLACKGLH